LILSSCHRTRHAPALAQARFQYADAQLGVTGPKVLPGYRS
jgi:hypothetical protein